MVAIYKTMWKLCRMLKLCHMIAVHFLVISYKFHHQPNWLCIVVSIRVNGVWDVHSVFHRVFFSCLNMTDFKQPQWSNFYRNETRWMLRLRTSYSRCGMMLLIKNQPCESGQKDFVKDRESLQDNDCVGHPFTLPADEKVRKYANWFGLIDVSQYMR